MDELYEVIVECLMQGRNLAWSRLQSFCDDPYDVTRAMSMCAFYGVAVSDAPHSKLKFMREVEPMMAITVPSQT